MRTRALVPLLLVPLASAACAASGTRARLEAAAEALALRPNAPALHLDALEAYFERGARGDAQRVLDHTRRLLKLDPAREDEVEARLRAAERGFRTQPLTESEELTDERIAASLEAIAGFSDHEDTIQAGLAERMVDRDLSAPLLDYRAAKAEFARVFGWEGPAAAEDDEAWAARFREMKAEPPPTGWIRTFRQAMERSISRAQDEALRDRQRRRARGEADPEVLDFRGEPVPDPLMLRNDAMMAVWSDDFPNAVEGFLSVIAAAEVRKDLARTGVEEVLTEEEVLPDEPPPGPDSPAALDAMRAAERQAAQAALETVEALSNPEIPPREVLAQADEVAVAGAVGDPLVLDLNGDGRAGVGGGLLPDGVLTGPTIRFDLDGDGFPERTEWLDGSGDGLLAFDLDGDGRITSGRELFGNALGDRDGYARLAVLDLDGDGWVAGPEASELVVWKSERSELRTLAELGITALSCRPVDGKAEVRHADRVGLSFEWLPDIDVRRLP